MRCTGHFVPPLERANLLPPDSKWRQFASTLPYIVGPESCCLLCWHTHVRRALK